MSATSDLKNLTQLIERQSKTTVELTRTSDFAGIAGVIGRNLLTDESHVVTLYLSEVNSDGNGIHLYRAASANHEAVDQAGDNLDISPADLGQSLKQVIEEAAAAVIADVSKEADMGDNLRAWLLEHGKPAIACLPLHWNGQTFGWVAISGETLKLSAQELQIYQSIADQVSGLAQVHHLTEASTQAWDINERQARAFSELNSGQDWGQMAAIVARNMLPTPGRYITLGKFVYSTSGHINSWKIVASANRERSFDWDYETTDWVSLPSEVQEAILEGRPYIIEDVSTLTPSDVGPGFYATLASNGVKSFVSIPIMIDDKPTASLAVASRIPYHFSKEEITAYRNLADQIGALLYASTLLHDAQVAHDIANNLVLANRMIISAKNDDDMAGAVIYTIARSMSAVAISLFDRPAEGGNLPLTQNVVAVATPDGPLTIHRGQFRNRAPSANQIEILRRGMPLIVKNIHADDSLFSDETQTQYARMSINWCACFGLRAGSQLLGTLDILNTGSNSISPEQIDAYNTLADQIGIALEKRDLLESTAQNLEEIQILYEVNRSILAAQDTLDILRTLRQHVAPDAAVINLVNVEYEGDKIQKVGVGYINTPTNEQVGDFTPDGPIDADRIAALEDYWNKSASALMVIEDTDNAPDNDPMAAFYNQTAVKSVVSIAIRDRGLVQEVVNLAFSYPQIFSQQQRRLYEALGDQIGIVLQSHRLLRDAQVSASQLGSQVRVLQVVNQLAVTLSRTQNESDLLDISAQAMTEATGVDHCGILIVNPQETLGTVVSEYPALGTLHLQIDVTNNDLYNIIRDTKQPVISNDIQNDPRVTAATKDSMKTLGIYALAFFPIFVYDRLFGSIGLDVYSPKRPFTPEVLNIAQTITAQVAIGLQNLRLLGDAQRRAEQLQRITAFNQSVQATLDMATIFDIMLNECTQMLAQDQMSIAIYDQVASQLRTVAYHADEFNTVDLTGGEIVPISGPIEKVWESWELLHIPDTRSMGEKISSKITARSLIIAPIISHGRLLGVTSVGSLRPYLYTETDVVVFQQMVNQLAIAIENTDAFNQSQRVAKNEALVNEISSQLQRQLDIHSMLDVTVNELGKILGARKARIRLSTTAPSPDDE